MIWFALGFLTACVWGWGCYQMGKRSAENMFLKQREKENAQVEKVFLSTADLQRDELLKRVRASAQTKSGRMPDRV